MKRLLDLLTHDDADWRRQGLELATTLDGSVLRELFDVLQLGPWLLSRERMVSAELLVALASSDDHSDRREAIRDLPPIFCDDAATLAAVALGFPAARLRMVWTGDPTQLGFLKDVPLRSLWLAAAAWRGGILSLPDTLHSLVLVGTGPLPKIEAKALRSLAIADAMAPGSLDAIAPQLERLHLIDESVHADAIANYFPRLRDLRLTRLPPDLRTGAPLERLHLARGAGRGPLNHAAVGADTQLRVDDWVAPDPSMQGDPRPVWIGPSDDALLWTKLLPTFPRLEVVDFSHRYAERTALSLPRSLLPAPRTLWEPAHHRPYLDADAHARAVAAWAKRGRSAWLRCTQPTKRKIHAIKIVRGLAPMGLRDAKVFVEAAQADELVALTLAEAAQWQAVLSMADIRVAIEGS